MKAGASGLAAAALLAFAGAALAALGGQLDEIQAFYVEYAGGGSCKLRGGGALETLVWVGVLALPASAVAAAVFAAQRRWALLVVALVVLVCLVRVDFLPIAFELCSPLFPTVAR